MSKRVEIDPQLANRLSSLREQPARDPEKTAQGRAAFLAQAERLATSYSPVVNLAKQPHNHGWLFSLQWKAIVTIVIIVLLTLGGGSITVAAAQNSLPNQLLYPIKLWSEDIRVSLAVRDQTRAELVLEFAERRAEEIQIILSYGQTPSAAIQARMQVEIDRALQMAGNQPDPEVPQALRPICEQLQSQVQQFQLIPPLTDHSANASLSHIQTLLQDRLQICLAGMLDPAILRDQEHNQVQPSPAASSPTPGPKAGQTGFPQETFTLTPVHRYGPGPGDAGDGNNPWTTGTPTPGSGYGSGSEGGTGGNNLGVTGTPSPMSGNGPGPGSGGITPGPAGTSGSGSGGSNGSGGTDSGGGDNSGGSGGSGGKHP